MFCTFRSFLKNVSIARSQSYSSTFSSIYSVVQGFTIRSLVPLCICWKVGEPVLFSPFSEPFFQYSPLNSESFIKCILCEFIYKQLSLSSLFCCTDLFIFLLLFLSQFHNIFITDECLYIWTGKSTLFAPFFSGVIYLFFDISYVFYRNL